jgi:hypothetical protein
MVAPRRASSATGGPQLTGGRAQRAHERRWRHLTAGVCAAAAVLVVCVPARASVMVALDTQGASLRVDAAGNAEVSWTAPDGSHRTLTIDRDGAMRYGGAGVGADVSHPASAVEIPWAIVVRQAPDGSYYALQAWQRLVGHPVELRFSRWQGDPTKLTLDAACCKWGGENIKGYATFHGKPIFGYHATPKGAPLDPYGRNVYLDTFRDGKWERMMGILTHSPNGFYSLWIRPVWAGTLYRGTISGPNWGWTLGPDALAQTSSSR